MAASVHHWTIDQWEALPARHRRFYWERWHDEGLWLTTEEKAEQDAKQAAEQSEEFQREQLVSAGQQMGMAPDTRVGPLVDASQLAPQEWPGEVIDLRRK